MNETQSGRCPSCNKPLPHEITQCVEELKNKRKKLNSELKNVKAANDRLRDKIRELDRKDKDNRWQALFIREAIKFFGAEPVVPKNYPAMNWPEVRFRFDPVPEKDYMLVRIEE